MWWVRHGEAQSNEGGKDQRRVPWSHDQRGRVQAFREAGACGMSRSFSGEQRQREEKGKRAQHEGTAGPRPICSFLQCLSRFLRRQELFSILGIHQ